MKILIAHNYYQQPGGEDQVFAAESALLEQHGHEVVRYTVHNDTIAGMGKLQLAKATVWNSQQYRTVRALLREQSPAVLHVHNTLPQISPSIYYAAKAENVPVIQTLHNYRYSCVNGLFFRNGVVCEDCLGKAAPLPGVILGCYRNSRTASAVVAGMLAYHKLRRTYSDMVNIYIALTEFSRQKFIEAGLPAEKIMVKPNFVAPDPGVGSGNGGYALFVGRLSQEKGLDTLLAAWAEIGKSLPLRIVGDGPLAPILAEPQVAGVEWLGRQPRETVLELMKKANILVFPSVWYEGFPMTLVEAFAVGLPVVTSNLGGMAELVEHGNNGIHFQAGNAKDLFSLVHSLLSRPDVVVKMRQAARREFELKYTADRNYSQLQAIYNEVLK